MLFVLADIPKSEPRTTICSYTSKTRAICEVAGDSKDDVTEKNNDGKTWNCHSAYGSGTGKPTMEISELKNANNKAQISKEQLTTGENDTKALIV